MLILFVSVYLGVHGIQHYLAWINQRYHQAERRKRDRLATASAARAAEYAGARGRFAHILHGAMSLIFIGLLTSGAFPYFDAAGGTLFPGHGDGIILLRSLWFLLGWNFWASCVPMGISLLYGEYVLARRHGIVTEEFSAFMIAHGLALLLGLAVNTFIVTALAAGIMFLPGYSWIFALLYLEGHRGSHVLAPPLIRNWRARAIAGYDLSPNSHHQLNHQLTLLANKVGLKQLRITIVSNPAPDEDRSDEENPTGAAGAAAVVSSPLMVRGWKRSTQLLIPAATLHQLSTSQIVVRAAHALSTYVQGDHRYPSNQTTLSYLALIIIATPLLYLLSTGTPILTTIGFAASTPYLTTWMIMLWSPLIRAVLINPGFYTSCRRICLSVDEQAAHLTSAAAIMTMIQEQAGEAEPHHPLYSWYHQAKPTPAERIAALRGR